MEILKKILTIIFIIIVIAAVIATFVITSMFLLFGLALEMIYHDIMRISSPLKSLSILIGWGGLCYALCKKLAQ